MTNLNFFLGIDVQSTTSNVIFRLHFFKVFPVFSFYSFFPFFHDVGKSNKLGSLTTSNRENPAEGRFHHYLEVALGELLELGEMQVQLVVDHVAVQNPDLGTRVDGDDKSLEYVSRILRSSLPV
jgi:hypothetical protein